MAIETKSFSIQGYEDNYTTYTITYQDIRYDGKYVNVDIHTVRDSDWAIIDSGSLHLYVNGTEVDTKSHSPFDEPGNSATLSGLASSGDSVKIEFRDDGWLDGGVGAEFTDTVPELDVTVNSISFEPAEPTTEDRDNDNLKAVIEITNNSELDQLYLETTSNSPGGDKSMEPGYSGVPPGETGTIGFNVNFFDIFFNVDEPIPTGDYELCIGGTCGSFTLSKPDPLEVIDIYPEPENPAENEDWRVVAEIKNTSDRTLDTQVKTLRVSAGDSVTEKDIAVATYEPGQTRQVMVQDNQIGELLGIGKPPEGEYMVCME